MLHLQEQAKYDQQNQNLLLKDRLPDFINPPCQMEVIYSVEANDDYYVMHIQTKSDLNVICQRCMQDFTNVYENQTVIAVCKTDQRAEQLLPLYDCIVSPDWQLDLKELVIDELHLYAPQFHPEMVDCDSEVIKILKENK